MDLHLSLVGHRDLPGQIYRNLRGAILDGRLAGGQRLPATRELAVQLGVSRTTVAGAYDRLISEGYATARVGSGTFVNANVARQEARKNHPSRALRPQRIWASLRPPTALLVRQAE